MSHAVVWPGPVVHWLRCDELGCRLARGHAGACEREAVPPVPICACEPDRPALDCPSHGRAQP